MFCEKCGKEAKTSDKFCAHCGYALQNVNHDIKTSEHSVTEAERKKYRRRVWICVLGPFAGFILMTLLWGIMNLVFGSSDSVLYQFFTSTFIPLVFAICFLMFPVGIVLAIYYNLQGKM